VPAEYSPNTYTLIYIQSSFPLLFLLSFNFFVAIVPYANLPEEFQINKHLVFFIFSKIIFLFPFLSTICTNDQMNKLQDPLKKRKRKFKKKHEVEILFIFLMHAIATELTNADCSITP
jgi:hypothetical protein